MTTVKITWIGKEGEERTELFGEFQKTNAQSIQKAIDHCLDDYNRDGSLIEKNIIKIEIED